MNIQVTNCQKRNSKRETESLLIAAQDNAIRTNYVKVKTNKTQQNHKCMLYGERDKTNNHIIKSSKLAQKKYTIGWGRWSTRNCTKNLNLTILPNGICTNQNLSWRMRHPKFSGILRYKKTKTCQIVNFAIPVDHKVEIQENENRVKYLDLARELRKW